MSIVDFHTHIFPPEVIRQRERYLEKDAWFGCLYADPKSRMATAEDLVVSMDRAGIRMSVTFGFAWADPDLDRMANDYVAAALKRYPDRLIGYAVVNPRSGTTALREAERCVSEGCRGIGELMPDGQGYALDDLETLKSLAGLLAENDLPLLTHTNEPVGHEYHGKGRTTPEVVYRFASAFPKTRLICAHWGGGLPFYELMPEVRHTLANVYYDTAASLFLYDKHVFALAGQVCIDKILFATDYPLIAQERFLKHIGAAGLDPGSLEKLLGGNAERVLFQNEERAHV
jgi:hypothetical protein